VPAGDLDQPAAQRGADQRAHQRRDGDEADGFQELVLGEGAQHHQAADGHQHGAAHALQHARGNQLIEAGRGRAGDGAGGEQGDGEREDALRAEAVGQPARAGDDHRHRERIGHHHRLHAQGLLAQAARHRRQRGVDDGRVQQLHEHADGDDPQHQARVGGTLGSVGVRRHGRGNKNGTAGLQRRSA
jgi:hypothetical protein